MDSGQSYDALPREDLIKRIRDLEARLAGNKVPRDQKQRARPFDYAKANFRPIALKLSYMGAGYHGFAAQDADTVRTIESELFKALRKAKLVDESVDRKEWNYSRCGRTDAGVSAFGQVIALRLRSRRSRADADDSEGNLGEPTEPELPYMSILNRLLPAAIRIWAWSPVTDDFSARFDCRARKYRYFFPRLPHYDLGAMRQAAKLLEGTHDFRNFCKVDPSKPNQSFNRTVLHTGVIEDLGANVGYSDTTSCTTPLLPGFSAFEIVGTSFLWHQVRCLMAVLLLVAEGREKPEAVAELLDIERQPRTKDGELKGRPLYTMAPELPLVLVDCYFDEERVSWRTEDDGVESRPPNATENTDIVAQSIFSMWKDCTTQEILLRELARAVPHQQGDRRPWDGPASRYKPLLQRDREPPVEGRIKRRHGPLESNNMTMT